MCLHHSRTRTSLYLLYSTVFVLVCSISLAFFRVLAFLSFCLLPPHFLTKSDTLCIFCPVCLVFWTALLLSIWLACQLVYVARISYFVYCYVFPYWLGLRLLSNSRLSIFVVALRRSLLLHVSLTRMTKSTLISFPHIYWYPDINLDVVLSCKPQ